MKVRWSKPNNTVAESYNITMNPSVPGVNLSSGSVLFSVTNPEVTVTGLIPGQNITLEFTVVIREVSSEVVQKSYRGSKLFIIDTALHGHMNE